MKLNKDKAQQGADKVSFNLTLKADIPDMQQEIRNEAGKCFGFVSAVSGQVELNLYLPDAIRENNLKPFGLLDLIYLQICKSTVLDQLQELFDKQGYTAKVKEFECNITLPVQKAKISDVLDLLSCTVADKKTCSIKYVKRNDNGIGTGTFTVIGRKRPHYYIVKCYNKTAQLRDKKYNIPAKTPEELRIEIIFRELTLKKLFGDKCSIEDVLTEKALLKVFREYKQVFENEILRDIRQYRDACTIKMDEIIDEYGNCEAAILQGIETQALFDRAIYFESVKRWCHRSHPQRNVTRETEKAQQLLKNTNISRGILSTIKDFRTACG